MSARQVGKVAAELIAAHRAAQPRLTRIANHLRDRAQEIYVPRAATAEYRRLVDQAKFNVLRTIVSSLAQNLYIDGYRSSTLDGRVSSAANVPIWNDAWQPNRMDSRQSRLFRPAITYGWSYGLVLPGRMADKDTAVITPLSPKRCTALYDDPANDEWPRYALVTRSKLHRPASLWSDPLAESDLGDGVRVEIYDDQARYRLVRRNGGWLVDGEAEEHGLGVCPVVRYLDSDANDDDDDEWPPGKVEPLLSAQRQLNQTTFGLLMAQQYAAFRQRWVTGMAVPEDAQGRPVEPWNAAVNRVWQATSPDTKFGEFAETNLDGYLASRDKTLMYVSSVAQQPPHTLVIGSGISNVSAEALAALEAARRQDIFEHQNSFGESAEQMLRLAGLAMGNTEAWNDMSSQVVWRDTTPRSLAQIADALGKLATQLGVPPRALWERIPGVTDQDIARWEEMADVDDLLGAFDRDEQTGDQGAEPASAGADADASPAA